MNQSALVRRVESAVADCPASSMTSDKSEAPATAVSWPSQGHPLDEPVGEEMEITIKCVTEFENNEDVRMIEARGGAGLALEALEGCRDPFS